MLCFSRDSEILKQLPDQPAFMQVSLKGRPNTTENTLVFPPSGVIPFHGFTMYGKKRKYLKTGFCQVLVIFACSVAKYFC